MALVKTLDRVTAEVHPVQPLQPTVGDEFQGVFRDVASASLAVLLIRLELLRMTDVRFGIGWGDVTMIDQGREPFIQDGSAWWSARKALHELAHSGRRRHRSWLIAAEPGLGSEGAAIESRGQFAATVNAYLWCRDQLIDNLHPLSREMLLLSLRGATQSDLAEQFGVTQGAVSQRFARGIGAVRDAQRNLGSAFQ